MYVCYRYVLGSCMAIFLGFFNYFSALTKPERHFGAVLEWVCVNCQLGGYRDGCFVLLLLNLHTANLRLKNNLA